MYPKTTKDAADLLCAGAVGASAPAAAGRERPDEQGPRALGRRYWAATLAGLAAYALYVGLGVGAWTGVALVALGAFGVLAWSRPDAGAQRAAVSAGLLVLAVLHARVLHGGAPSPLVQLALAAAVAASAATTLLAQRGPVSRLAALLIALAAALLFAARFPSWQAVAATATGGLFAWLRPLGRLSVAARTLGLHAGPPDPALASPQPREVP